MTEAPVHVQDKLIFKDAPEFMSAEDVIIQRLASLSSASLSEGTGRQFRLTDNGKQESRDLFHQYITPSGSYYEQREIIQHLRERRNELSGDQARILDRMTSSFQMQTEYVRSIQTAEELKTSPVWERYVHTVKTHSTYTTDQIWRKIAQTVAKQRTEIVEQIALYKVPPHKQYIESLVALREVEAASYQYQTLTAVLHDNPSQSLDVSFQTQRIYGNIERFTDSVNDLQLGLEIEKMYSLMEQASTRDRQRMELIETIETPSSDEFVLPQQVEAIKEYIVEEVAPTQQPAVTLEKVQQKFKLPKKLVVNIVGAAIGIISSWSPITSPVVSSSEQVNITPPAITLESQTYNTISPQIDLRYDFMNPVAVASRAETSALSEATTAFADNSFAIENRGILLAGEPGRYIGEYKPNQKPVEITGDIKQMIDTFSEKQRTFHNHMAFKLETGTSYSIAIANTDIDKSGAITNRFEVSPQSPLFIEINGLEQWPDGSVAFRLNDTYVGNSKQRMDSQSGASYIVFPKEDLSHVMSMLQNTQERLSAAMFAVSDTGSITNINTGVVNLNSYFQNQTGEISMVAATHLAETNLQQYGYTKGKTVSGTDVAGGVCKAVTLFNNIIARTLEKTKTTYTYLSHKNHSSGAYNPVITGDTPVQASQNEWIDATVAAEPGQVITDLSVQHDGAVNAHGEILYSAETTDGKSASFIVVNADITNQ